MLLGQLGIHMQQNEVGQTPCTTQKSTPKWSENYMLELQLELLEEIIGVILCDHRLCNE